MPVQIVPTPNVVSTGGTFILNPNPSTVLFQETPRIGVNPMLYETIDPALTITVQAIGGCPLPALPELITSVTLVPGQGATGYTGAGNKIIKLVDIATKPVPDIPAFLMPQWFEPRMAYGAVAGPPSPTMALVAPLRGYYSEKYFYDAEYIYASYYANTPEFQGSFYGDIAEGVVPDVNRLTSVSLLEGKKFLPLDQVPEGVTDLSTDMFPGPSIPIDLTQLAPITEATVLTEGSTYFSTFTSEVSSWVKWRPSFIEIMQYNYTLIVTHTCPPFVTSFQGYMLVSNNWTPAANRLAYYINLQKGFLDTPTGEFEITPV